ncbi:DUF3019 domain-containing protein [Teredinibacter turnerae]|uniref:DUF3019 domain-containing protein n=1 Tax=Teredinibacter turnerae TaxID=2426 RepID=UPI001E4B5E87|nr:DUF3019 domain-containing protein [Teredinibacter turnerae]
MVPKRRGQRSALIFLVACWCCLHSALSVSQVVGSVTELSVAPRLCLLSEKSPECHEQVRVSWESAEARSVCLFQSGREVPIACWEQTTNGGVTLQLAAADTITFELRDFTDTSINLATAEFKVMHDKKKYRRSRRNPWSFF